MSTHATELATSGSFQAEEQFRDEMAWIDENGITYAGRWVALVGKTLLASGDSAREVFEAAKCPNGTPLIQYIEGETLPFAGW